MDNYGTYRHVKINPADEVLPDAGLASVPVEMMFCTCTGGPTYITFGITARGVGSHDRKDGRLIQ